MGRSVGWSVGLLISRSVSQSVSQSVCSKIYFAIIAIVIDIRYLFSAKSRKEEKANSIYCNRYFQNVYGSALSLKENVRNFLKSVILLLMQ